MIQVYLINHYLYAWKSIISGKVETVANICFCDESSDHSFFAHESSKCGCYGLYWYCSSMLAKVRTLLSYVLATELAHKSPHRSQPCSNPLLNLSNPSIWRFGTNECKIRVSDLRPKDKGDSCFWKLRIRGRDVRTQQCPYYAGS